MQKDDQPSQRHLTQAGAKTETHLSPAAAAAYQGRQCGNFRRVSGLHKRNTHTLAGPNVCIKKALRIGLRLNYCLMLREALFFL